MPEPTSNEAIRDALLRRQIQVLRLSAGLERRVRKLLDASELELREKILAEAQKIMAAGLRSSTAQRRLESLLAAVRQIRSAAHAAAYTELVDQLRQLSKAEVGATIATITAEVPVVLDLATPDLRRVVSLVGTNPMRGRTLKSWAKSLERSDLDRITSQIRLGVLEGEPVPDIARRIVGSARLRGNDGVTQITRNQATALTRTAVNHFSSAARREVVEENEEIIELEVYQATLDDRTTVVCMGLDGQKFPPADGPFPPQHFQCRSVRVPVIDGKVISQRPMKEATEKDLVREYAERENLGTVSSRDALPRGHKGKFDEFSRGRIRELTGQTPAETTYSQFLGRQSIAFQEEVLGTTKAQLFRKGGLELRKFVNRAGDELSLSDLARLHKDAFIRAGLDPETFL